MSAIRAVLAVSPELLQDLVEDLLRRQEWITILATVPNDPQAVDTVRRLRPDVLITTQRGTGLPPHQEELFLHLPRLRIITILPDGSAATVYELRLHALHAEDFSPADLLAAIQLPPPPFLL